MSIGALTSGFRFMAAPLMVVLSEKALAGEQGAPVPAIGTVPLVASAE
jgi:hypothetical protein